MKLSSAILCLNCEEIYNEDHYSYCPSCGDMHSLRLLPILQPMNPIGATTNDTELPVTDDPDVQHSNNV